MSTEQADRPDPAIILALGVSFRKPSQRALVASVWQHFDGQQEHRSGRAAMRRQFWLGRWFPTGQWKMRPVLSLSGNGFSFRLQL